MGSTRKVPSGMRMDRWTSPTRPARRSSTGLRRAPGQMDGIAAMFESGRSCQDVATRLAAASKALDKAGYTPAAASMQRCPLTDAADRKLTAEELQRLFIGLTRPYVSNPDRNSRTRPQLSKSR
jgi:DNA-binding FrmR family transcriptional regulator